MTAGASSSPADAPAVPAAEIFGFTSAEVTARVGAILESAGERPFRIRQIREWIYHKTPAEFEGMSDLPRRLRQRLGEELVLFPIQVQELKTSRDGTQKALWARAAGGTIESVLIPDRDRVTYCISTQAGCPVKCTFCATGYGGFQGQLRPAEIVGQVLALRRITGTPPTNIVYMGMGEPLLNFDAVQRSLEILTAPDQVGFGARRITVSTVGIPERIRELGELFPQVKLALSFHAARDDLRDEIIPLNRKFPLSAVLDAVRDHTRATGKNATFEYIVLPDVNDSEADARAVVERLRGIPSRINLIGFNPFPEAPYSKPAVQRLLTFRTWLERRGYEGPVTIRRSRGEDIQGACGQLSLLHAKELEPAPMDQKKDPGLGERSPGSKVGRKEKS